MTRSTFRLTLTAAVAALFLGAAPVVAADAPAPVSVSFQWTNTTTKESVTQNIVPVIDLPQRLVQAQEAAYIQNINRQEDGTLAIKPGIFYSARLLELTPRTNGAFDIGYLELESSSSTIPDQPKVLPVIGQLAGPGETVFALPGGKSIKVTVTP